MPRTFKPIGGFPHDTAVAITINDEGDNFKVLADGKQEPYGYVGFGNVFKPLYSIYEMQNLIKSQRWVEVKPEDATKPLPVPGSELTPPTQEQPAPQRAAPQRSLSPQSPVPTSSDK